jgi:hypothetical protein
MSQSKPTKHETDNRAWQTAYPPDAGLHRLARHAFRALKIISLIVMASGFLAACIASGDDTPAPVTNWFVPVGFIGLAGALVFGAISSFLNE